MNDFFSKIIAPTTIHDFFNAYHEKDVLHVKRNDTSYYNQILTSEEISDFLDRQDVFYPSLRIVKEGKEIPNSEYVRKGVPIGHHKKDGIINTDKAFALFNAGSTLVIQAGQRYFDNLSKCCLALSQHFNSPVQANLYITPNRSVGFNPHWDTHDVFVLQIAGTKSWKLYGFEKELPTKNQKFVSKGYSKEPLQNIQLTPGDFLYVPRGYVHDAMADDGISAHITIGVLSYTWARLFSEVFPQLEEIRDFREAVPFWNENLKELIGEKAKLLQKTITELDFNKGITRLNNNYNQVQPQSVNRYFQSILDVKKITPTTQLSINEGVVIHVTESDGGVQLKLFDKVITIPFEWKLLVDSIITQKKFTPADLPDGDTSEGKQTILSKLIKEGVLHIENL